MAEKKVSPKASTYVKTKVRKGIPLIVAKRWEARKKKINATKKGKK